VSALPNSMPGQQAGSAIPEPGDRPSRRQAFAAIQQRYQPMQLLALVLLFVWGATTITGFTGRTSVLAMLVTASFLGLAGAGQTIVILVGGIDFSVPAFIAAGAVIVSQLCGSDGWSFIPAFLVVIAFSLILGGMSGYISHRFRVQPLVVTLGMSSIVTGALLGWTHAATTGEAPTFLSNLTSVAGKTFGIGIPPVVVIWAVVAIVIGVVLRRTAAGRRLYATGANPNAAELALVNTRKVWIATFAISAGLGGMLGILIAGYAGSGNVALGDPYLFEGLAAVIVGGTAFGARGNYWKTVIGALVLTVLSTVLLGKGYSNADQQMVYGVIILAVVGGYGRDSRLRDRI
jgi:ribose transport system permease protein